MTSTSPVRGTGLWLARIAGPLIAVLLMASGVLTIATRQASAQTVYTQYFSLTCEYWGEANITYSQSLARASTTRTNSCADYARVSYDYYWGGQWNGTYDNWCYDSYQYACVKENSAGATQVYTYHQIYTQGAWRDVRNGYASW